MSYSGINNTRKHENNDKFWRHNNFDESDFTYFMLNNDISISHRD